MSVKILAIITLAASAALVGLYLNQSTTVARIQNSAAEISGLDEPWLNEAFLTWALQNDKTYGSYEEQAYRLKVFRDNFLFIQKHRTEGHSFKLTINKFADLTQEEFRARYLTLKPETKNSYNPVYLPANDLPEFVDWRDQGIVAPVKDQGQCGSCWAFSAIAAIEGLNAQKSGQLALLSEQQLVDCSRTQGNQGCNGGLMDYAFTYAQKNGLLTEAQYPYTARDGKCKAAGQTPTFSIKGYSDVPKNDNDQLAAAVAERVVSVAIEADTEVFQFYESGVIDSRSCGTQLDHGVAVVGYGVEKGVNFWLVRNSWGSSWGDKGYVKILRQSGKGTGICGIAEMASYPTA